MKTILSWDVGIKNLAYCLIKKINDIDFVILKWGVINLLTDDQEKCQFELRTGGICQEIAKYCVYHREKEHIFNNDTGTMLVCSRHKEKSIPLVRNIQEESKNKKQKKKSQQESDKLDQQSELKCCCNCDNKVAYVLGNSNNCWCENHYEKKGQSFIKKIHAKKISVTSCSKQPIQSLAEKLFTILDADFHNFVEASEVLIENQPTLKNPKMKTLSAILYSYFVLRGILDKKTTGSKIEEVKFVSPSNKLKVNSTTTDSLIQKEKDKKESKEKNNVYKLTKTLGVKYCRALISEKDDKIIDQVKKKDDMCDAFLQGFQYLFSPVPDEHFKKLQKIGFDSVEKKTKVKKNKDTEISTNDTVEEFSDNSSDHDEKPKKINKNTKISKVTSNADKNDKN